MFQQYHSVPTQVDAVQITKNNKDQVFNLYGDGDVAIGDWVIKDDQTYYLVEDNMFRKQYVGPMKLWEG